MRSPLVACLALLTIALVMPSVPAHHGDETHDYVAQAPVTIIWCDEGGHAVIPQDDPYYYSDPVAWLFSEEPECFVGDTVFGTDNPHGLGGVYFVPYENDPFYSLPYRDHRGEIALFHPMDQVGPAPVRIVIDQPIAGDYVAEGCGSVLFQVPWEANSHWLSEMQFAWAWLEPIRVDGDLQLCLGTTGVVDIAYLG